MKNDVWRIRAALISVFVLIATGVATHAAANLMRIRAHANDAFAVRGGAAFGECLFANTSFVNTVESTLTVSVRFADGSEVVTLASETQVFGPQEAFIFRSAVVVAENAPVGTAVWTCRAESTIVGGPRPQGQMAVDTDAAAFEVIDVESSDGD
jgi:hypothetical protein